MLPRPPYWRGTFCQCHRACFVSTETKAILQCLSRNSSWQFWKAITSVGHTKEKAAGMKSKSSQGASGSGVVGDVEGRMKELNEIPASV